VETPLEQALPLRITVLEGDLAQRVLMAGQAPGVVVLQGRSLPLDSITFEGTQRARAEYYPGNPEATIQTHGPTEQPTTISGVWKDRYLGDGAARQLHAVFEDIRRRGPMLEVSWGDSILAQDDALAIGDPFTRRGVLKRTKFTYPFPQRCIWEMEFLWAGLAELVAGPVTATEILNPAAGSVDVSDSLSDLEAFVGAFTEFTETVLVGAPARVLDQIDSALSALGAASTAVAQAGAAAQSANTVPAQAMDQLVGALAQGMDASRLVIEAFEVWPLVVTAVKDDAISIYEAMTNRMTVLGTARTSFDKCRVASENMAQATTPDVLVEVRVPSGTDLREIAARYYDGDADGWVEIANYNGFETSRVPEPPTGPADTDWPAIKVPRRGLATSLAAGC
jgi:hypothetical protein